MPQGQRVESPTSDARPGVSTLYRTSRSVSGWPRWGGARRAWNLLQRFGSVQGLDPQTQAGGGGRQTPPPFLVIVRRGAAQLYGTLEVQLEGQAEVRMIWDRRLAERRVHGAPMSPVSVDRRAGDRRRPPPVSWALGVVFAPEGGGTPEPAPPLPPDGS